MKYVASIVRTTPKAVLFDWDNTLFFQPDEKFLRIFNKALESFGYPPGVMKDLKQSNSSYDSFVASIKCSQTASKAHMRFQELFAQDPISHENLMPGTRQLLETLHSYNIPMGIVSNLDHKLLSEQIEALNLSHYFKVIYGSQEGAPIKPDPSPLIDAIKIMGLRPSKNIWYVGDTPETDILCANNAGCYSVLVGKRWNNNIKPDFKADNLTNLLHILPNKPLISNNIFATY